MFLLQKHSFRSAVKGRLTAIAGVMAVAFGALSVSTFPVFAVEMLSPAAYKRISKLQETAETGDHTQMRIMAEAALAKNRGGAYERAITLQLLSHSVAALGDYLGASRVLDEALSLEAFDPISARSVRFDLARLYIAASELDRGIVLLEAWFQEAEKPNPNAFMLLAQVYAQKTDYTKALPPAQSAVRFSKQPREEWYRFLSALHYEVGDIAGMAKVLRTMVAHWPQKDRYWSRLAWAYESLEEPAEARAVLEMANKQGVLVEEKQLMRLARLYLHEGVPNRAARVVRQGLEDQIIEGSVENWSLLVDALTRSEDHDAAIEALEQAVNLTNGNLLHVRLAQAYLGGGRWPDVVRVTKKGLEMNKATKPGELYLALGIAQFRLGNKKAAQDALNQAAREEKTRKGAEQWLALLPRRREMMP